MAATDPLLERYRTIRCPAGAHPEIDLDREAVVCITPDGREVAPLPEPAPEKAGAALGVLGWSAVIAGGMALLAFGIRRWG